MVVLLVKLEVLSSFNDHVHSLDEKMLLITYYNKADNDIKQIP